LATVETRKPESPTREGTTASIDVKGLIIQFMAWCETQGYPEGNKYHHYLKRLVRLGANLLDPESVKETIGKHKCKNGTKMLFVYAYAAFNRMLKVTWEPPKYKQEETLPFVPEESELDQLIASCHGKRMASFPSMLERDLRGSRRGPWVTLDRYLRQHNNDKQACQRTPSGTNSSFQQSARDVKQSTKNFRAHLSCKI